MRKVKTGMHVTLDTVCKRPSRASSHRLLIGGLIGVGCLLLGSRGGAQRGTAVDVPVSHVGLAVPNLERAVEAYADVFGIPAPRLNESLALASPTGGPPAIARAATFALPNFLIELEEPKTTFGPIQDVVRPDAPIGHHLSVGIAADFPTFRERLLAGGGQWKGGTATTGWAYVDFRDVFGLMLEPITMPIFTNLSKMSDTAAVSTTLGAANVVGVGIVVADASKAATRYAGLFGVDTPAAQEQQMDGNNGSVRFVRWRHQNGIAVEFDQPLGTTGPYAAALKARGANALHRLAFVVGDRFDAAASALAAKGGRLIFQRGRDVAFFDFTTPLGVVIEIDRTASMWASH